MRQRQNPQAKPQQHARASSSPPLQAAGRGGVALLPPAQRPAQPGPRPSSQATTPPSALPAPLRAGIQALSGLDLADVQVHRQSARPAQVGAQAFAQGGHIHLAPGFERHLPHEAWHVVQQRQGRVAATLQAKGQALNDSPALEREADQMGRLAQQRGQQAGGEAAPGATATYATPDNSASAGSDHGSVMQRNVGMEVETSAQWQVWTDVAQPKPVPKGRPIVHRGHFQLQAEYAGDALSNLEFVTNQPGTTDRAEYENCRDGMIGLGQELEGRKGQPRFNAAELVGGDPRYAIQPGKDGLSAHLQVTVGVPLASLPALFKNLAAINVQAPYALGSTADDSVQRLGPAVAQAIGLQKASDELLGFITLIQQYLKEGGDPKNPTAPVATFPKGVFSLLARTDFNAMFGMLPPHEQQAIVGNLKAWIDTLLQTGAGTLAADQPVMRQVFDDPQSTAPAMRITTPRSEWLGQMPERDLLSYKGKQSASLAPRPSGKPRSGLRAEAKKAASGLALPQGKRTPNAPTAIHSAQAQPLQLPVKRGALKALVHELKDLYQGMGGLGDKTDTLVLDAKQPQQAPTRSNAVILEIRRAAGLSDAASGWKTLMDEVYNAVDDAILFPKGKPMGTAPASQRPSYHGQLSRPQIKDRKALDKLRTTLAQLNAYAQHKKMDLAQHQQLVIDHLGQGEREHSIQGLLDEMAKGPPLLAE